MKNPNYYELKGKSNQHLYEYISEMVENKLGELERRGDIILNDNDILLNNNINKKEKKQLKNLELNYLRLLKNQRRKEKKKKKRNKKMKSLDSFGE